METIYNRKSIYALKYILKDYVLEDFQCVDALQAVHRKISLLGWDTGLGKTLLASAIMRMLYNENNTRKFLFICKKTQFAQTPKKIAEATGLKVLAISSEATSLNSRLYNGKFLDYDIVILAEEVLNDITACCVLLETRKAFAGIFVDEIHTMCNTQEADRAGILNAMMKNFEYRYGMTATPMTTELAQYCRILTMLEPEIFENPKDTKYELERGLLEVERDYPGLYLRRTRADLGIANVYNNKIHMVPAMPHQVGASGHDLFQTTKGKGAVSQLNKLVEILDVEKGRKGIIYIHHHDIRKYVTAELNARGIEHGCINGLTNSKEKKRVMDAFNSNQLQLVITSVTVAIDLDSDFVVFMQYNANVRQLLGRAERGLICKEINLHWLFTEDTDEMEYFLKNIYSRSIILQSILHRDYRMLLEVGRKVRRKNQ